MKEKIELLSSAGTLWNLFQKLCAELLVQSHSNVQLVNTALHFLNSDKTEARRLRERIAQLTLGEGRLLRLIKYEQLCYEVQEDGVAVAISWMNGLNTQRMQLGDKVNVKAGRALGVIVQIRNPRVGRNILCVMMEGASALKEYQFYRIDEVCVCDSVSGLPCNFDI